VVVIEPPHPPSPLPPSIVHTQAHEAPLGQVTSTYTVTTTHAKTIHLFNYLFTHLCVARVLCVVCRVRKATGRSGDEVCTEEREGKCVAA